MTTRISKIARLPHPIREQLNHRLQNGQIGRITVAWLNSQLETKAIMVEFFEGRTITTQNLSEWRRSGYQDWLQHQDRMQWYDRFTEQDTELRTHDRTVDDAFEGLGRLFVMEIGLGLAALQRIKNPHERCEKMQRLIREFARVQNSYNRSRRTQLEFDKNNGKYRKSTTLTVPKPVEPVLGAPASSPERAGGVPPPVPSAPPLPGTDSKPETPNPKPETGNSQPEKRENNPEAGGASVLASRLDTPPAPETTPTPANQDTDGSSSSSFCILPSALPPVASPGAHVNPELETPNPKPETRPPNPQPINVIQALPTASTPTPLNSQTIISQQSPPPIRRPGYYDPRPPIRGRRPRYLEG